MRACRAVKVNGQRLAVSQLLFQLRGQNNVAVVRVVKLGDGGWVELTFMVRIVACGFFLFVHRNKRDRSEQDDNDAAKCEQFFQRSLSFLCWRMTVQLNNIMIIKAVNAKNGMVINPSQFIYCPVHGMRPQLMAYS